MPGLVHTAKVCATWWCNVLLLLLLLSVHLHLSKQLFDDPHQMLGKDLFCWPTFTLDWMCHKLTEDRGEGGLGVGAYLWYTS